MEEVVPLETQVATLSLSEEIGVCKQQLKGAREEVAKLRRDVQYYQSQNQKLQQEKELSDSQCQVPSDDIDVRDLQRQLTNEKAKRDALEKDLLAMKHEKNLIEHELYKTMEELEQSKKKSGQHAYEQENKLLGDRLRSLETQVIDLERDRNRLQRDKDEVTRQLRHAQTTNITAYQQEVLLQEKVRQLEEQLKEFNQSNNLSMAFEELVEENERLSTKLNDQFRDHQKEGERWDSDRAQLLIQISNLEGEVRDLSYVYLKATSLTATPDKTKNKGWWSEPQNTIFEEEPINNGEYSEEQPGPFKRSMSSNGGINASAKPMNVGSSGSAPSHAKSELVMRIQFNEMQRKVKAQALELRRLLAENRELNKHLEDPPPNPSEGKRTTGTHSQETMHESTEAKPAKQINATEAKKSIDRVLVLHHANLTGLPASSHSALGDKLYTSGQISIGLKSKPTIEEIIGEFKASLAFLKEVTQIEDHCMKFLEAFTAVGGSYGTAAIALYEEWTGIGLNIELN